MQNTIAFFEIPATDFHRAVDFYETVLGIRLAAEEHPDEKMAFFPALNGEGYPGAISCASGFEPSVSGVLIHFRCADIGQALDRVILKGGTVSIPKTKIECPDRGWFAVFTDTEGNRIGLYSDK